MSCHPVSAPLKKSNAASRAPSVPPILPFVLLLILSQAAGSANAERFTGDAESREVSQSNDGRFTVAGKLVASEAVQSVDGRFVVHSVNTPKVACGGDPIFGNGFEP